MSESFGFLSQRPGPEGPGSPAEVFPASVQPFRDSQAVRWLEESIPAGQGARGVGIQLRLLLPGGYDSYARILHPATTKQDSRPVRWAEVAAREGKVAHPLMQLGRLAGADSYDECPDWLDQPSRGQIPESEGQALLDSLGRFTATPHDCYFCIWDGYGHLERGRNYAAKINLPDRSFFVFAGPLKALLDFTSGDSQIGPNLWFPADRAWCVATDIDLMDTYVGGRAEAIRYILENPLLEAYPSAIEARIDFGADTINT